jgi:DNA-directed RNA polymerase specialized sigma24 family protein
MMITVTQREEIRALLQATLDGLEATERMFAAEELREWVSNDLQAWCADQRAAACADAVDDLGVAGVAQEVGISAVKVRLLLGRARAAEARA